MSNSKDSALISQRSRNYKFKMGTAGGTTGDLAGDREEDCDKAGAAAGLRENMIIK